MLNAYPPINLKQTNRKTKNIAMCLMMRAVRKYPVPFPLDAVLWILMHTAVSVPQIKLYYHDFIDITEKP